MCPKCGKTNNCGWWGTNKENLVIILEDENKYQCCFCGNKFTETDSLDYEWDKMIEHFAEIATPEICLEWALSSHSDSKNIEKSLGIGDYGLSRAFFTHFKINIKSISRSELKSLKTQFDRDKTINSIINIT